MKKYKMRFATRVWQVTPSLAEGRSQENIHLGKNYFEADVFTENQIMEKSVIGITVLEVLSKK